MKKTNNQIVCESSLQAFFLDKLYEINQKSNAPVAPEVLFYSSQVLDAYSDPKNFYEISDGKASEKVLGIKLLESEQLSKPKRKKVLTEVGDTALFICGFFHESLNRKLFHLKYYHDIGKKAYDKLDGLSLKKSGQLSVFGMMSCSFDKVTNMMTVLSQASGTSGAMLSNLVSLVIADGSKLKVS